MKVWRPELYLTLSLKWRNKWTLLVNLTVVVGFLAWLGVPEGKEDATIRRLMLILGSIILFTLLTQLVIMVEQTGGWRKITRKLLCWSSYCLGPGPSLVLPFVEEVITPQPASQVTFIF